MDRRLNPSLFQTKSDPLPLNWRGHAQRRAARRLRFRRRLHPARGGRGPFQ